MKDKDSYVPPWVGPCAYCAEHIGEKGDYVCLSITEHGSADRLEQVRLVFEASFCSEDCFQRFFAVSRKFKTKWQPPPGEYKLARRRYVEENLDEFSCCAFCGSIIDDERDYFVNFWADGKLNGEATLLYLINFCSEECFNKATKLKMKLLELAVDAYSPERCIKNKIEPGHFMPG